MTIQRAKDIRRIAVLGAGTMGPGIAQVFAMSGRHVTMWTRSAQTRARAEETLGKSLDAFVGEGVLSEKQTRETLGRISFCRSVEEAAADADFVLETIVENKEAKIALFDTLDACLGKDVIIASNTSALNVFELIPPHRLEQAVIAHWYAPAQIIPLVDVVRSEQAPDFRVAAVVELLEECGKTPVVMKKFIRGYIVNRMQMCLNQEVFHLLDNDFCTPEDIDKAVKSSFIPRAVVLGLCKRVDFTGLDMVANNFRNRSYTPPPQTDMPATLARHLEKGELGFKSGRGFYDYTGLDRQALLARRDKQLLEIFGLVKKFMDDPV
jgi:3-hydroxybutyryl-CoA dehydrogenase